MSQQQGGSTQPTNSSTVPTISKEGNEDLFENLLITLRTLQMQNKRLIDFQVSSYKWHLQHHENIKKIIGGLNILGERLEQVGIQGYPIKLSDDPLLKESSEALAGRNYFNKDDTIALQETNASSSSDRSVFNLHQTVISFFKRSRVSEKERLEFEQGLQSVSDTETFETLKEDSFNTLLPMITNWFKTIRTTKFGLIFLNEGIRLFPKVFQSRSNRKYFSVIISELEKLQSEDLETIGVPFDDIKNLYGELLAFAGVEEEQIF